jgi:tetratricopeptide (TPR) repeat protein
MEAAFPDFQKIRPYGPKGDKGNDGYRPEKGIYYQIYAPRTPDEKEAEAARKLKRDFGKLKTGWGHISEINEFHFVFNDKFGGVSIEIEDALAELRKTNPGIKFKIFLPKHLEGAFFDLKIETILGLGFDIDLRNTLRVCTESLDKLEVFLDRGNGGFVLKSLQSSRDIIAKQNDEILLKNWEILECRALLRLEKISEAKQKFENLCKRYPNDPRPFLHLAELYLNIEDYVTNDKFLKRAEGIDSSFWLLRIGMLFRNLRLRNKIDPSSIDEQTFPAEPRPKSIFYRMYALALAQEKDFARAESYIERAISLNPDRLENYSAKLSILEAKIYCESGNNIKLRSGYEKLLLELESILKRIAEWERVNPRNQVTFNIIKIKTFRLQENSSDLERLSQESFYLVLQCYFDVQMDHLLTELISFVQLPEEDFSKLLAYVQEAEKGISDELAKILLLQFAWRGSLLKEGRSFFERTKKENMLSLLSNMENKRDEDVWNCVKSDLGFAVALANSTKDFPELRRKIIEKLPDDGNIQKDKLLLLLNYDESHFGEAFDILKEMDLSRLSFFECQIVLEVVRQKGAWDFSVLMLDKLLQHEKDPNVSLQLKVELMDANLKLDRLPDAIRIGEEILSNGKELEQLGDSNKENLLANTIIAKLKRGEYPEALEIAEKFSSLGKTFEYKAGVEAEVYLKNGQAQRAIDSIVSAVKIIKTPTVEQYAKLFVPFGEIGNMIDFPLTSLETFQPESFVKFKDKETWYFVGDGDELDAIRISSGNDRYTEFLERKVGEKVVFGTKYAPSVEHVIENILPIEKYILWKSAYYFNQLSAEGSLESVRVIAVPEKDGTIDTKNILAFLEDDRKGRAGFFDLYCRENVPLAFLATSEGSLMNAIGLIQTEGKGFVRFSSGDLSEFNQQIEVAKRIIEGSPFYIDGTSALILSETGLLLEIYSNLPALRVPQSVIAMLLKFKEKFNYVPGHAGYLQYIKGQLHISKNDQDRRESLQKKFGDTVKLLELKPGDIYAISAASKADRFTEQKVPSELCDACVLAQKSEAAVLTEDYFYLQANSLETGKEIPAYCSSLALVRVLYEQKKITFDTYLNFFAYLSGYRFRFLQLSADDIGKAVFGDGPISIVRPEKIRWFNFPLTLSEEYGVPFATAFGVISIFLMRILTDDVIAPDTAERIFIEILSTFPTDKDKRILGKLLLSVCVRTIKNVHGSVIIGTNVQRKIDRLFQLAEIYVDGNRLWTPSKR